MPASPHPRPAARWRLLLAGLLTGLVAVAGTPVLARAQTTVEVRITDALDPASVTVAPGTTVTWVNRDTERHRVRSTGGPVELDSGNLDPGQRFSHTFATEGTTTYLDDRDRDDVAYHGTVVVTSSPLPSPSPAPSAPSGPRTHDVSMAGRRFSPATLSITTGDTVRFVNDDDRDHTATARDRSFDSGLLGTGRTFTRTFTRAGTFAYLCLLHPDMVGTIAVADAGGTAPPPAPTPTPTSPPAPTPTPTSPPTPGAPTAGPTRVEVAMRDFAFAPATLEVVAGSTVVFRNTGQALHTATARDGTFDSDLVAPGGAYERRFDRAGTFAYLCLLHPEMTGRVVVTAAGSGGEPPGGGPGGDAATVPGTGSAAGAIGATGAAPPRAPGTVVVSLRDLVFAPSTVDIRVGDTIRFRNDGEALHTATARDGSYDSGLLRPGQVADRTFRRAGTFAYWCTLHPQMVATIRVAAVDGTVPAGAPGGDSPDGVDPTASPTADASTGGATPAGPATVSVVDDAFLPDVVEVAAGQEVIWTNDGAAMHTVTATDGSWDSGLVASGEDFRLRFDEPGTVTYLCSLHPGMTGEVRVVAASDGAVAAAPDPTRGVAAAVERQPGLPVAALEILMLGIFVVALAGFTVVSGRFARRGGDVGAG